MSRRLKQGDIIKTNFNPQAGHEQAGYRPAVVVSCEMFNKTTQMPVVCPITNTMRAFPFHVALNEHTTTTGVIQCEQVKTLDINERGYSFIEELPADLLRQVLNILQRTFIYDEPQTPKESDNCKKRD
ncbi:MAG: type II toxin-antitoxin system PemK/MazF family toxin [Oscillospiraceae bacterium]|jgi:mRNA interferase MazF|nr:type II toxin-antitoxin system PemK/MazF family toxin [Oscillospiraceae bacterium]